MKSTLCFLHSSCAALRYPSSGMITPASPWIGSRMKHASSLACVSSWRSSPARSLKLTLMWPPWCGAKPCVTSGSHESEMHAVVRPWKQPQHESTRALPYGTPLTSYAHFLAILSAVSTPSAPVFIGSTRSYPNVRVIFSAKSGNLSLKNAREERVSECACSTSAPMMRGCWWPWLTAEYAERKSK
eukprot:Amastigsp_a765_530.p4 type:complete len:186 gc:universal Amastigsp_a765_530:938-381(-)